MELFPRTEFHFVTAHGRGLWVEPVRPGETESEFCAPSGVPPLTESSQLTTKIVEGLDYTVDYDDLGAGWCRNEDNGLMLPKTSTGTFQVANFLYQNVSVGPDGVSSPKCEAECRGLKKCVG